MVLSYISHTDDIATCILCPVFALGLITFDCGVLILVSSQLSHALFSTQSVGTIVYLQPMCLIL